MLNDTSAYLIDATITLSLFFSKENIPHHVYQAKMLQEPVIRVQPSRRAASQDIRLQEATARLAIDLTHRTFGPKRPTSNRHEAYQDIRLQESTEPLAQERSPTAFRGSIRPNKSHCRRRPPRGSHRGGYRTGYDRNGPEGPFFERVNNIQDQWGNSPHNMF